MIRTLAILYTYLCNARCAMCMTSSGPHRQEKMEISEVKSYIDQAMAIPGFKSICFTGGEPLIFKEEILDLLRYSRERGLFAKLISNGFWATDVERAREVLEELRESGLRFLSMSTDVFHDPYIKIDRIANALEAARSVQLGKELSIVVGRRGEEDLAARLERILPRPFVCASTAEIERRVLEGDPGVGELLSIVRMPLQRIGDAANLPEGEFRLLSNRALDMGCPVVGHVAGILPGGDVYWCCCSWGPGRSLNDAFVQGNANRESLSDIDGRMQRDSRIPFLVERGPLDLRRRVYERAGRGPLAEDRFASICEVCVGTFREHSDVEIRGVTEETVLLHNTTTA